MASPRCRGSRARCPGGTSSILCPPCSGRCGFPLSEKDMNAFILFLVLLKATVTSFAGLASISVVRDELVVHRHVLTDEQLNEAVVVTRSTPGPVGLYVVAVGYPASNFRLVDELVAVRASNLEPRRLK
ncbi:chromate transporter [Paraburkholderia sediminicola]|uniref:chromate transporter n=2 Tax=Paraburkholderia sediminicola TaxID=458836 RepID=UPI0038BC07FF